MPVRASLVLPVPAWRCALPLLAGLVVFLHPAPAAAAPIVNLSWNGCTSPVDLPATSGPVRAVVVTEQGLTGSVTGFQCTIRVSSSFSGLADAWRFDPAGCNAGNWRTVFQPAGTSCPLLHGAGMPITLSQFEYVLPVPGVLPVGRIRFAAGYSPAATAGGGLQTVVQFVFDQSASKFGDTSPESCGCLSRPTCFDFQSVSYLDGNGIEIPVGWGQSYVTWEDPNNASLTCYVISDPFFRTAATSYPDTSCVPQVPVPAHPASWGHVKGMYRDLAR